MSSIGLVNKSNFASGSMFVPGDFGSNRNASSVCFKMNPIQATLGFCEGIIDDAEMEDQQDSAGGVNQSSMKDTNMQMFQNDSIEALKDKSIPKFQIAPQFEGVSLGKQTDFRDPYGQKKEETRPNPSKLENDDQNSELSV